MSWLDGALERGERFESASSMADALLSSARKASSGAEGRGEGAWPGVASASGLARYLGACWGPRLSLQRARLRAWLEQDTRWREGF